MCAFRDKGPFWENLLQFCFQVSRGITDGSPAHFTVELGNASCCLEYAAACSKTHTLRWLENKTKSTQQQSHQELEAFQLTNALISQVQW